MVNSSYCWEILRFLNIPFLLTPFFLSVEVAKELRTEGKRQGYLRIQVIFWGFTTVL